VECVPEAGAADQVEQQFLIYIPLVILAAALLADRIALRESRRNLLAAAALGALLLINAVKDRDFYQAQQYAPDTIVNAWQAAHAATAAPRIRFIGAYVDAENHIEMRGNGNDLIAAGASQFACYNPIFGYRLERFPAKTLHPGPVLAETDGLLNLKNPVCYLYPEQNGCTPGDHFTVAQREAAQAFADYKPYPVKLSAAQLAANFVTRATLVLLALLLVVALVRRAKFSDK
jgi:hypothetical protein